ncbi:MAG: c-type cytochrome [Acidobacteriota bacterium]
MRRKMTVALTALVIGGGGLLGLIVMVTHGFSARDDPTAVEVWLARSLRHLAVPRPLRIVTNPVPGGPESLSKARAHFADHCALCHGNDGKGQTQIGQNMYPKAPDMTAGSTQDLSDGELFYIIKNGVRLTGMPAWGEDTPEDDVESWNLVHFIRHLPELNAGEVQLMEELNPRTRAEFEEEEEIRRFLDGGDPTPSPPPRHH